MKGFGKQIAAGLTVAIFIATATYMVVYTAGCSGGDSSHSDLTPTPTSGPTPKSAQAPSIPTATPC